MSFAVIYHANTYNNKIKFNPWITLDYLVIITAIKEDDTQWELGSQYQTSYQQ